MNQATKAFIEELKQKPEVKGIVLFGSWARGNNRSNSDVDLVVIWNEGHRRTVEYRNEQAFEIIYTTAQQALDYWAEHKDDAAGLWEVAQLLYDKDGSLERLREQTQEMLQKGKAPIDPFQLGQLRFDAEDTLRYVEETFEKDPATANLILNSKIFNLTELFFHIRQLWVPAPKQRLGKIKELSPELQGLIEKFYQAPCLTKERLEMARSIIALVFKE